MTQQEYISNLHEDFRRVVGSYLTAIEFFLTQPQITDADMRALEQYKTLLHGREALEIEHSLAEADVKQDVLDRIEKLNKDLVDMAIEHLTPDAVVKEFLKKLSYYQIEQNKRLAEIKLKDLQLLK